MQQIEFIEAELKASRDLSMMESTLTRDQDADEQCIFLEQAIQDAQAKALDANDADTPSPRFEDTIDSLLFDVALYDRVGESTGGGRGGRGVKQKSSPRVKDSKGIAKGNCILCFAYLRALPLLCINASVHFPCDPN
jgi:hypothetical protein